MAHMYAEGRDEEVHQILTHKKTALLAQVKKLSAKEKLAFFGMLLAYLKLIGLLEKSPASRAARSSKKKGKKERKKKRHMSPKQKAALRKAIHANQHMKPAAKRKALAKLR